MSELEPWDRLHTHHKLSVRAIPSDLLSRVDLIVPNRRSLESLATASHDGISSHCRQFYILYAIEKQKPGKQARFWMPFLQQFTLRSSRFAGHCAIDACHRSDHATKGSGLKPSRSIWKSSHHSCIRLRI